MEYLQEGIEVKFYNGKEEQSTRVYLVDYMLSNDMLYITQLKTSKIQLEIFYGSLKNRLPNLIYIIFFKIAFQ